MLLDDGETPWFSPFEKLFLDSWETNVTSSPLSEFKTEEEKAAARHALGIYNKGDVVAMSLLTAEDGLPTSD
jgi:hypothetical protein